MRISISALPSDFNINVEGQAKFGAQTLIVESFIVDHNGNFIVDELGNFLVQQTPILVNARLIRALPSDWNLNTE